MEKKLTIQEYIDAPFGEADLAKFDYQDPGRMKGIAFKLVLTVIIGLSVSMSLLGVGFEYGLDFLTYITAILAIIAVPLNCFSVWNDARKLSRMTLKIAELDGWEDIEGALVEVDVDADLLSKQASKDFYERILTTGRKVRSFEIDILKYMNEVDDPRWRDKEMAY